MAASSSTQPSIIDTEFAPTRANLIREPWTRLPGQAGGGRVIIAEEPPTSAAARQEGQLWWEG